MCLCGYSKRDPSPARRSTDTIWRDTSNGSTKQTTEATADGGKSFGIARSATFATRSISAIIFIPSATCSALKVLQAILHSHNRRYPDDTFLACEGGKSIPQIIELYQRDTNCLKEVRMEKDIQFDFDQRHRLIRGRTIPLPGK